MMPQQFSLLSNANYPPDANGREPGSHVEVQRQIASAWASLAALRGFPDRDRRVAVLKPFAF